MPAAILCQGREGEQSGTPKRLKQIWFQIVKKVSTSDGVTARPAFADIGSPLHANVPDAVNHGRLQTPDVLCNECWFVNCSTVPSLPACIASAM
eukprot:jgi/Chrzof1/10339/Cz04g38130.t1